LKKGSCLLVQCLSKKNTLASAYMRGVKPKT
jgi:hypothetical protein